MTANTCPASAVAGARVQCAYQIIQDAHTAEKALYHEGLARLIAQDGQILAGAQFIPQLESRGEICRLDRQIVDIVIDDLTRVPHLVLGCNISAATVQNPEIWCDILDTISRSGVASRMILEITETYPFRDGTQINSLLAQAQKIGCRIAIDDFGAGYLSPSQLLQMEPDIIKIDASMLWNVRGHPKGANSLSHIVSFGMSIAGVVVVEGVENQEQWEIALASGATHVQGLFVGKPSMIIHGAEG
ncbi:EAL domain-containing protein [Agrobacterium sp. 22-214-1]